MWSFSETEKKIKSHDTQLAENKNDTMNINLMVQQSLPAKQGISTNSFKLAVKENNDLFKFIQKNK